MFFGVNTQHFMPHGHCILWKSEILLPIVISDIIIFLSYTSIPVALYLFQKRRNDLSDNSRLVLFLFFLFIFLCGLTHIISAWNYWHSDYVLEMFVKILTAVVSFITALKLFQLLPILVKIPSIEDHAKVIEELKQVNEELEKRVEARTKEIQEKNRLLTKVFNGISEGIVQYYPVYDEENKIIDFKNRALNDTALREAGLEQLEQLEVESIKDFPGVMESGHFERCIQVYEDKTTLVKDPVYNQVFKRYFREVVHRPENEDYLIVYFTDVTDREDMKIAKLSQTKLLALGELAGGIAHEINTPLQILSGYTRKVERSLSEDLKTENQENFVVITNTLKFINQLIKNLKSLSQGNATSPVPIELASFFEKSLFFVEKRIQKQQIKLIKGYENSEVKEIIFNEVSLFQIITNLMNNAMDSVIEKKTQSDDYLPEISINTFKEEKHMIIEIADNGLGIDQEIIDRIFDPLFTTKEKSKGTGLGLSLSQKLAMDMNATLRVIQNDRTRFQLVIKYE